MTQDKRDIRDPEEVGKEYTKLRVMNVPKHIAVTAPAKDYDDGGHISSDPAKHHSKTSQTEGSLHDGGGDA